ncbi:DUF11 domain-containing protein [Moheibacter lacus]|uniref:DUF11 domain-containing protein n=1 Tax=Moheibacter lacus TaxID=2745851 RepID=A0A838ZUG4_9FLAO|nr:DUF11 domain-containing protein [Moheibacter lacus]MBA5630592.1 hypothetical protein [Moheibacter lacus]
MKNIKQIFADLFSTSLLLLLTLLCSVPLLADGSKDLYPSGAPGVRAYLRSSTAATENWPFPTEGTHYVYAKAGERITLASSVQNLSGNPRIRLISPSGTTVVNNTNTGRITNRTAELAGPQLFGQTGGNRYTPIYYTVPVGGDGIYRVEFVGRTTATPSTTYNANDNWSQGSDGIVAWDVSVINTANTGFIKGRVYANVLNFTNGTNQANSSGFYGRMYTRTKDGYTYRVNNNGNNGLYFTFFVNNNGFLDETTQEPIYKSLNGSTSTFLDGKVHDPRIADTSINITHKIFYTLPSTDLPTSSSGAVPGGTTWLSNPVTVPTVSNVVVTGVEGTPGQVSNKGGYIEFDADVQGNYNIVIESTPSNPTFATRVITGSSTAGHNTIYWDGEDGNGNESPVGTFPVNITVQLQGAEVHFPYIDMEYNRFGTILELLNHNNLNVVVSDIVYWDDRDIANVTNGSNPSPKNNSHLPPANSTGISSTSNGHKWGVGGSGVSGQFGDEKAIDTWTFIKGEEVTIQAEVIVKIADLLISSLSADESIIYEGSELLYTVGVKNDGPSDVEDAGFFFTVPEGFTPVSYVFQTNSCGIESTALTFNPTTNTYTSKLDLPSGCEITYLITIEATNLVTPGAQEVEAAILRPNDVTDPDATNSDITIPPTDPHFECDNNGQGGNCNNIMIHNNVTFDSPCVKPGLAGTPSGYSKTGILTKGKPSVANWPNVVPNGYLVLDAAQKGMVITHMNTLQRDALTPVEGMIIYNTELKCVQLYRGSTPGVDTARTGWNCIDKGCNE